MPTTQRRKRGHRGAAWYWKQTDSWYYTPTGTRKRVPLLDERGLRIRGIQNKSAANLALARVRLSTVWNPSTASIVGTAEVSPPWLVARVCAEYIQDLERRVTAGTVVAEYYRGAKSYLNRLCEYCGALSVAELQKGHLQLWIEKHSQVWGPVTQRNVIACVLAAFNHAQREFGIRHPLKGFKKPPISPRLQSFSPDDEQMLYAATEPCFRDFLFAAIHSGLRPYCELARLTADDIEETAHGMMWRVDSSKTRKTRKIPVRPELAQLTRRLMKAAPRGSQRRLFRNPQGNAWKKVTGVHRFLALKRKLGWDQDPVRTKYSTYTCRHTFAHRMLSGYWNGGIGCSVEILAELIGDTPKVAYDHYGREWAQHYQDPLWQALGISSRVKVTRQRASKRAP